ncbi:MAG: MBL fold metallo-hydrolase [Lacisediminihabitans sp.]
MQPTSAAQFTAAANGTVPPLEQVRPDVWSLAAPMPRGHIPYSLLYLLRDADGGLHVIDPGWDSDENWTRFTSAVEHIGSRLGDVRSIVATHLHPDHLAMADRMRAATGAPLLLHQAEQRALVAQHSLFESADDVSTQLDAWGVPEDRRAEMVALSHRTPAGMPKSSDATIADHERLEIPGFELVVELTPGHTPGSICLRDDERGFMFTGDHILPTMHAGLGLGGLTKTNALADYLHALSRVHAYPDHEALPGHGYRFRGVAERASQHEEHHLRRNGEVAHVLASVEEPTIWEIASRLSWTAGWDNLRGFFVYSALLQTAMHRDYLLRNDPA